MLFQTRFHEGIRAGGVTLTFRAWQSPKVAAGRRYRFGSGEAIEVDAVDTVTVGSIRPRHARDAGFATVDELVSLLGKAARKRLTKASKIFRVTFHYAGSQGAPGEELRQETSKQSLDEVRARLERMDRLSGRKPWTRDALNLIDKHPRTAASKLAPRMDRELAAFKADIRKLKKLGLTVSHEVGYELSLRGRAVLRRWRRAGAK